MLKRFMLLTSLTICSNAFAADPLDEFYEQMRYLSARDRQLASNIANVDTPQYKAQDVKKGSKQESVGMYSTHPSHFSLSDASQEFIKFDADFDEMKPNGNNVNPKAELFKKSENSNQLTEVTNAYAKAKAMINLAIMGSGK